MEDQELRQRLDMMEVQIAEMHKLATRLYRILLWTIIISVALFVLPLIGVLFELPSLINTYSTIGNIQ